MSAEVPSSGGSGSGSSGDDKAPWLVRILTGIWLSETNDSGRTVGIKWWRVAMLSVGGWLVSVTVGFAQILQSLGEGAARLTGALGSWYYDLLGAIVELVTAPFEDGFSAAVNWLDLLGVGAGPVGLAILLIALLIWVRLE